MREPDDANVTAPEARASTPRRSSSDEAALVVTTPAPSPERSLGQKARGVATRVLLFGAGLGLFVGFFLPWVNLAKLVVLSGFSLASSSGQAVEILSGPNRTVLFIVPLSALALMGSAISGRAFGIWVALGTGVLILGYGLVTLIKFFFETTGLGMWLVVVSALLSLAIGLVGYGREEISK